MSSLSIFDAAREVPHAPAVVLETRTLGHAELAERVRQRLEALAPLRGAGPGALVSVAAEDTLTGLELLHALFEMGIPCLPLHSRLTGSERQALNERLAPTFHVDGDTEHTRLTPIDSESRPLSTAVASHRGGAPPGESPLALIMTSGTSGAARAAILSQRAFLAAASASAKNLGWYPDDRWLLCLPLAHIGGLSVVTRCLLARRPVVLSESWQRPSSGEALLAALVEGRATLVSVVPTQLLRLLEQVPRSQALPGHLRAILTGGAATPAALLSESTERGWPVLTTYGSTESCSQIATQAPGASTPRVHTGCGKPLEGVSLKLEDGRICLKGPMLFSGYHPHDTQPFDADGWFRTQDLGELGGDGELHVLGRADDIIISGGENVAPREVERVLERCPGVRQACVFGVVDARWGQSIAAALLVEERERGAVLTRVAAHVRQHLAAFKRPRQLACVDAFELGPTGKVDRQRTAETARQQLVALG